MLLSEKMTFEKGKTSLLSDGNEIHICVTFGRKGKDRSVVVKGLFIILGPPKHCGKVQTKGK